MLPREHPSNPLDRHIHEGSGRQGCVLLGPIQCLASGPFMDCSRKRAAAISGKDRIWACDFKQKYCEQKYTPPGGRKWSALLLSSGWLWASLLLELFTWSIFPSRSWWGAVTKVPIKLGGHNITDIPRRWGSNSTLIPGDLKKWPYSPPHWKMRTPLP